MRSLLGLTVALASIAGCSSGPACVIDTDCPLGNRCGADGVCHVVGEVMDTGVRTDAGPPRDAPAGDSRIDARPSDTGAGEGGTADAPDDAGSSCPVTAGTNPLTMVGASCTGLTATNVGFVETTPGTCSFTVQLDGTDAGSMSLSGRDLMGSITIGGTPTVCTATFPVAGGIDFTCDSGCTFSAGPRP